MTVSENLSKLENNAFLMNVFSFLSIYMQMFIANKLHVNCSENSSLKISNWSLLKYMAEAEILLSYYMLSFFTPCLLYCWDPSSWDKYDSCINTFFPTIFIWPFASKTVWNVTELSALHSVSHSASKNKSLLFLLVYNMQCQELQNPSLF